MTISKEILYTAKSFLKQCEERDTLNEKEDYDAAFEVECEQRDNGAMLAGFIIETFQKQQEQEPKEFEIYANDFCDSDIWKSVCEGVGVNYEEFDTLTLNYTEVKTSNQE